MKIIPLTQGKEAIVDDEDYEYLMQWKWTFSKSKRRGFGYALRSEGTRKQHQIILMHRLIAARSGLDIANRAVDHWDQNGLNNQRSNLRIATASQNQANRDRDSNNTSGFKGVSQCRQTGKWRAYVMAAGRFHHLGRFDSRHDAARAYNEAALKYYGEFACLNPV